MKHGALSSRLVIPRAQEIVTELAEHLPGYLSEPSYAPAVMAYAVTLARVERVATWLEAQDGGGIPELNGEGGVRPATDLLLKLERQAEAQRQRLGLDPLSRARLGKDVTQAQVSVTALLAERQRLRDRGVDPDA